MNSPTLINCPACGAQVSNQAPSCPRCGQPISGRTYQPSIPQQTSQPQTPAMFQQYSEPATKSGVGKKLGIGCLALFGFFVVLAVIGSMISSLHNRNTPGTQPAAATSYLSYPKERVQSGEKIYKGIEAKYKMPLGFTWMAKEISLSVPIDEWNALSKEDQINVTLYGESLISQVKANPRKYIDEWKRRTGGLETNYGTFVDNASHLCDQCWQVVVGKLVKDDGKFDIIEEETIGGENAEAFRRQTEKKVITYTEPANVMSPGDYLSEAKKLLGDNPDAASDDDVVKAYFYLKEIPPSAPEYKEARGIIPRIERRAIRAAKKSLEPYATTK